MDINNLRKICQSSRKNVDTLHAKLICRPISIYITILFIKMRVTANTVTVIFLIMGLINCFLLLFYNPILYFIAALLFEFWYILDHVDGEVARYNNNTSKTGAYLDLMTHYLVHPLIFISIGFGLYTHSGNIYNVVFGMLAGLSMIYITLTSDIKDIVLGPVSPHPAPLPVVAREDTSFFKKIFSSLHTICCCPQFINILLVVSVINLFTQNSILPFFLIFYAVLGNFIWTSRFIYSVSKRNLNGENKHA